MVTKKLKPKSIEEYIMTSAPEIQERLRHVHEAIRSAAPGSKEELKWGMPAYSYKRILVAFAAFKNHIGFYPTPSAVTAFLKELSRYKTAKGSIQFPHDQTLPLPLIKKITKFRVKESKQQDALWKP
jgi:uncharacterized protein YdhG (YjbR/CyaY superfamily)